MARTKAFDPEEVLSRALGIFGTQGYEGTSLPDLLKGLGIARQSLYDTYGTKRELFLAAVQFYMNRKQADIVELFREPGGAEERIRQAFGEIVSALSDPQQRQDCFIISSAIEYMPHDEELNAYMQANQLDVEKAFYDLLERGRAAGELRADADLERLSLFLAHERNALVLTGKMGADRTKLEAVAETALSVLRWQRAAGSGADRAE
ncbi:TetR/AcrR family transcriptional regulator [Saccharibacillus brassicae]|uniref:TetR/AcrR family transcriptional regulator n=1 Tax=Saccharibacillus brassicae TaxID=2583377 RepID=UPI00147961B7|nr:TetR/AcrR family transcriptional regulator [Saccharibacillus brassicae]